VRSLLIEILDISSPENLENLQLNGKNTLDPRSQTDGDALHASNINKILILRYRETCLPILKNFRLS